MWGLVCNGQKQPRGGAAGEAAGRVPVREDDDLCLLEAEEVVHIYFVGRTGRICQQTRCGGVQEREESGRASRHLGWAPGGPCP